MIDAIFLLISFGLFAISVFMLMYDMISPKLERNKSLGKKLPKFTGISLLFIILSILMLVIASLPYMRVTV